MEGDTITLVGKELELINQSTEEFIRLIVKIRRSEVLLGHVYCECISPSPRFPTQGFFSPKRTPSNPPLPTSPKQHRISFPSGLEFQQLKSVFPSRPSVNPSQKSQDGR